MVQRVCRNLLDDPNDIHDAVQAVFLVLARRAGSIRRRTAVGSWLYGVAVRVAARARVAAIRRRVRDRRAIAAAGVLAAAGSGPGSGPPLECDEGAAVVHQEVHRLPEKYRAPVVLCYLEGLTHDEAALRLSWPVGTVRSRLARARDTLRTRLTRRGVTAPAAVGPVAAWLAGDPVASSAVAATVVAPAVGLPAPFSTSLARAATGLAAGQPATAGLWPAAPLVLAQGVLTTMMLKKLMIATCALVTLTIATSSGLVLVRASQTQNPTPAPAAALSQPTQPADAAKPVAKPEEIDPLLQQLLDAARKRVQAQQAYYEDGRITIDRFIEALIALEKVQLKAAKTPAERTAIRQRHLVLLNEIETRETAELAVGRGTDADMAEARQRRLEAEFEFKSSGQEADHMTSILRRLDALERRVAELQRIHASRGELEPHPRAKPGAEPAPRQ